ncbi:jg24686 [Pararge aegeria aegeria]|uniref:Jg24686 protein n=1 Tax=Pararge aegeria aegeria TaxID=348720 RepID=A0A8S4QHG4_9NEOP|nr:jg24686 [Pararge aegeria aegeria]
MKSRKKLKSTAKKTIFQHSEICDAELKSRNPIYTEGIQRIVNASRNLNYIEGPESTAPLSSTHDKDKNISVGIESKAPSVEQCDVKLFKIPKEKYNTESKIRKRKHNVKTVKKEHSNENLNKSPNDSTKKVKNKELMNKIPKPCKTYLRNVFACDHCEYVAKKKNNLIRHLMTHTGVKPYSCNLCDYKSTQSLLLANHKRTHTGEKPYSCSYCDFKCGSNSSIRTHVKIHTEEKRYACKYCKYECRLNGSLVRHMRTHTGERPFSCSVCDYKFKQKSALVTHMRRHTGEKPYSCDACSYKSTCKSTLLRHKAKHERKKSYSCKYCEYKSTKSSALLSHMKKHSGEKTHFCKLCEYAKRRKYENLDSSFIFVPFGVETLGPWGPEARALYKELSKRVIESSGDPRAGSDLGQRISLAIQRGNVPAS